MKTYIVIVVLVIGIAIWASSESLVVDKTTSEVPSKAPENMVMASELQQTAPASELQNAATVDQLPFNVFMSLRHAR